MACGTKRVKEIIRLSLLWSLLSLTCHHIIQRCHKAQTEDEDDEEDTDLDRNHSGSFGSDPGVDTKTYPVDPREVGGNHCNKHTFGKGI